jgi:hypothetical protein
VDGDVNGSGELVPDWYRPPAPYEPGNDAAVTHGAYSAGQWKPRAEAFRRAYESSADTPSWVLQEKFRADREAWYQAEAVCGLLADWLNETGIQAAAAEVSETSESETGKRGGPRSRSAKTRRTEPVLLLLHRWQGRAAQLRRSLGADPASFAQIGRDVSVVQRLQEAGLERMQQAGAGIVVERAEMVAAGYGQMTVAEYRQRKAARTLPPPGQA